jgi:hypothetical protein
VVREWSKVEVARVRDETEARIATRKKALDGEIDAHSAVVETRIQCVSATVQAFQAEMDEFFERLLSEQDPTRIATMAETMPDPPDLAGIAASITAPDVEPFDPLQTRLPAIESAAADPVEPPLSAVGPEVIEAAEAEAAMAARLAFTAAEVEALAFAGDPDEEDPSAASTEADAPAVVSATVATITSGLAKADAGTLSLPVPSGGETTRVIVLGLVSVASIATFKRGLSRSAGVASVAVASGPDGEFIFTVEHGPDVRMADTVTALDGFGAQITTESAETIEVTAHDLDTGN